VRLRRVTKFSKTVTKDLLPTQQATIAQVACALLVARCLLLAEIARHFETAVKFSHNLKRVFRFASNPRLSARPDPGPGLQPLTAQQQVARRKIRHLRRRLRLQPHQPLEIIVDWTSVGDFQLLSALVGVAGRAVPVLQWSVRKWEFRKSQNAFEYEMLRALRRVIARSEPVVIVADRGFGRTELFRFLDEIGFLYCIRIKGDAWVRFARYEGALKDYPVHVGQTYKLSRVAYHKRQQYALKLVLTCARIKGKASTWLLATNTRETARHLVDIYRRRFWCEEDFRDLKQAFAIEAVRVKTAEHLDVLLMALAIVVYLLAVLGLRADKLGYATQFATPKKGTRTVSWFHLALDMLKQSPKHLDLLFHAQAAVFQLRWA
jgi:hypothetical protein